MKLTDKQLIEKVRETMRHSKLNTKPLYCGTCRECGFTFYFGKSNNIVPYCPNCGSYQSVILKECQGDIYE